MKEVKAAGRTKRALDDLVASAIVDKQGLEAKSFDFVGIGSTYDLLPSTKRG